MRAIALCLAACLLNAIPPASADEDTGEPKARIYTTREERREAGEDHHVLSWLTLSDLFEVEAGRQWIASSDPFPDTRDRDLTSTLEFGVLAAPATWMKAEAIFELEHQFEGEAPVGTLDEGTVSLLYRGFELEGGRVYVPFGEYFSHFASGPLLEFGETRGDGADLSFNPDERLDVSVFAYNGPAEPESGSQMDWGCALAGSPLDEWKMGVSYISDLADAKDHLLADFGNRYASRVDGLSAYSILGAGRFEITAELVQALNAFKELPGDRNQPFAWNVEVAFFPRGPIDAAFRVEGSRELVDAPRLQLGAALSWRPIRQASLTLEYLHGDYSADMNEREAAGRLGLLASFIL